jgi:hypothetical protein
MRNSLGAVEAKELVEVCKSLNNLKILDVDL